METLTTQGWAQALRLPSLSGRLQHLSIDPYESGAENVLLERRDYCVRLADSDGQRSRVSMLVNRMYAWRGYHAGSATESARRPNEITLEASYGQRLYSTLTLRLDGPDGLAADGLYGEIVDEQRLQGKRLCELTRLAADPRYSSKEILASLIHLSYIYARLMHGCTDAYIEVNPRHVAFYQRMLGFRRAGPERTCARVGAPAVLMHLPIDHMQEQIRLLAGGAGTEGARSLYPYFFSSHEETGLLRRILAQSRAQAGTRSGWSAPSLPTGLDGCTATPFGAPARSQRPSAPRNERSRTAAAEALA